jgi:glutamine cyclotransferase
MARYFIIPVIVFLSFHGCMKDDELWDFEHSQHKRPFRGLFVTNEGNFMYENASLSYYDMETGEVLNDVFFNTNALPLGDLAYSMTIRDSLGYVVINNSGRIYVINTSTFEYVGKITGFTSPRHIHFVSDTKAYVTDLYARSITVVNPVTMEITGSIDVNNGSESFFQHSTEQMVQVDRYLFTNCWSLDNMILVIDSETDQVVDSIEVLKQPNSMVLDRYNNLWVLTDGGYPGSPYGYEEPGLLKIEAGSRNVQVVHRFAQGEMPGALRINGTGDTLYYLNQHVFRYAIAAGSGPELFISGPSEAAGPGWYYGLDVDRVTSEVYVSDAIDFVQRGRVYRVTPGGVPVDTFQTGISPGSFCFKPGSP